MDMTWIRRTVIALTIVVVSPLALAASASAQDGVRIPVPHDQTISANPFGLMLNWYNVEYERKLNESATWGATLSNFSFDGADLMRVNFLMRYYPQDAALTGVFLGGRVGVARGTADDLDGSGHLFAAGFELGYSWLLGSKRNVGLSLGAGVDRLFGGDLNGRTLTWPNIRLVNVGVAF